MKPTVEMPGIGALQPSGGVSSSYLLHPKLFHIASKQLGRDIVAAVPSRDALMLLESRCPAAKPSQKIDRASAEPMY